MAGQGEARQGEVWLARRGSARPGAAWHGEARYGWRGVGEARYG